MPRVAGIESFRDAMSGFEIGMSSLVVGLVAFPLPFDGVVSSLSAIVLDEGYLGFLRKGIVSVDGVPVPDVLHIIPLR